MFKKFSILVFLLLSFFTSMAQKGHIKGLVVDSVERKKLQYSTVLLIRDADSILVKTTRVNADASFELKNLMKGNYTLLITYPKMADYIKSITLSDSSDIDLGRINMESKTTLLNEVVIQATKNATRMRGDTLVFQADSFAVRANANVQELLKRLPGIEVDKNGAIKAQGKEVKTVLVDGDEFFGDDPLLATKYLKANSVEEIQVYDKKSKNADLTGIDDGIKNKTINIKLKENAKNGYLATLDANQASHNFRDYGGMFGIFKNKLKAAVYGTTSTLANSSKVNMAMSSLKGGDYDMISVSDDGSAFAMTSDLNGDDGSGSGAGLPNNLNFGGHFSNKFQNKMGLKVNFKLFDNKSQNLTTSNSRELLPDSTLFISSGRNESKSNSVGKNININYSYQLDSLSTLKVAFDARHNKNTNNTSGVNDTRNELGLFISQNNQVNTNTGNTDNFSGNINWSKRFKKRGRTLAIDLQPENKSGSSFENSLNTTKYYDKDGVLTRTDNTNLNKNSTSSLNSFGTRISYSEPITSRLRLQATYSLKTISSSSNKQVSDDDHIKVDSLSNNFKFNNFSNIGKIMLQYGIKKFSIATGAEASQTNFELKDIDRKTSFNRNYINFSPNTNVNYRFGKGSNIAVNYNGNMRQPDISQLQPVRELNNPLYEVVGNPDLRPSFSNNFSFSYSSFAIATEQFITASFNYGFTNNAITSTEQVDEFNKRITSFTNINGNNSLSANLNYARGLRKQNMQLSLQMGYNNSNNISIVNLNKNKVTTNSYTVGLSFTYYTPKFDFSYTPNVSFMNGKSSIGGLNDGNSITHNHDINSNIKFYKFMLENTLSLSFRPKNASFDKDMNVATWNSAISARLLKDESLELKLSVTDILNQKVGYNRFVGGNVVREDTYSYIPRYILLGVSWNLSGNFVSKSANK